MVARVRLNNESFTEYKLSLSREEDAVKARLAGKVIWAHSNGTFNDGRNERKREKKAKRVLFLKKLGDRK